MRSRSGEELWSLEKENTSDFERQNTIGKAMNNVPAIEENDVTHEKMMEFEPSVRSLVRTQPPEHQPDTRGMPMPLSGIDSLVPGATESLLDTGCGRNSVNRATQSTAKGHSFCGELNAGVAMDRGEHDEISRVEGTNSGVNTCHRLQPEA